MTDDTIFALASGRPPAAIAIIRVSGPRADDAARALAGSLPPVRTPSLRTLRRTADGEAIDHALVLRFDGPHTATGENIVEFHCHGGRAVVDAVLAALEDLGGFRAADPGEFTRRALVNGRIDLTEAEGLADLLSAETELQRRSAMVRAGGALRAQLDGWRDRLLELSARAEVAIDYSDEEDGQAGDDLSGELKSLAKEMAMLALAPRIEPLRDGIRVVFAGPPNAGKSSLFNAILQSERAIVTPVAGTTRDVIEAPVSIGGVPFVLVDTAGLHESSDEVEAIGIGKARAEVGGADILLWLGARDAAPVRERVILLDAKSDLHVGRQDDADSGIRVSAVTGQGIATLTSRLSEVARAMLPRGDEIALGRRQHELVGMGAASVERAAALHDPILIAEELRSARDAIDRISGRAGVEDLLDALFGRFCLGK